MMPPLAHGSGWRMCTARFSSISRSVSRCTHRSPPAMGMVVFALTSTSESGASVSAGSSMKSGGSSSSARANFAASAGLKLRPW